MNTQCLSRTIKIQQRLNFKEAVRSVRTVATLRESGLVRGVFEAAIGEGKKNERKKERKYTNTLRLASLGSRTSHHGKSAFRCWFTRMPPPSPSPVVRVRGLSMQTSIDTDRHRDECNEHTPGEVWRAHRSLSYFSASHA